MLARVLRRLLGILCGLELFAKFLELAFSLFRFFLELLEQPRLLRQCLLHNESHGIRVGLRTLTS